MSQHFNTILVAAATHFFFLTLDNSYIDTVIWCSKFSILSLKEMWDSNNYYEFMSSSTTVTMFTLTLEIFLSLSLTKTKICLMTKLWMINCVDNTFSHAIIIHYFSSVSAGRFLILYELAGYYNNHKSLYIFYLLEPPNVYTPYKKYSRNYYNFLAQFSLSLLLLHFFSSTTTTTHSYTIFILFYRTDYFFLFFF